MSHPPSTWWAYVTTRSTATPALRVRSNACHRHIRAALRTVLHALSTRPDPMGIPIARYRAWSGRSA